MKDLIFSWNRLIMRQLALLILTLLGFSDFSFGDSTTRCEALFAADLDKASSRLDLIKNVSHLELAGLLLQMQKEGKLIYKGEHDFQPGTEYLASNEFDWLATPFDHKDADVLIAFGSNSSWEIAVDKNVKSLYMGDWSPYPLLASAYIISPLIKIAMTPKELIILLSGRIPTPETTIKSLDDVFSTSVRYASGTAPEKLPQTKAFLSYLAQHMEISDFDLKFLVSYFYGLAGQNTSKHSLGPFSNLRYASYAKLLNFYDQRYSPSIAQAQNQNITPTVTLENASVISSQKNFDKLKSLFVKNNVHYGLTSITDMQFYKTIHEIEKAKGHRSYSLSITNIFDCGDYNGLTHQDMLSYFLGAMNIFETAKSNPLVIFRTSNAQPPHGFHRYDLTQPQQVKKIPKD